MTGMTLKFFLSVFLLSLPVPSLFSSEISSCRIFKSSSSVSMDLSFDGAYSLKGLVYRDGVLFMPFDGYRDKKYDNIRLLSKSVYLSAEKAAIEGSCRGNGTYKKPEFRVLEMITFKSSGRAANVSLGIGEDFNVLAGVIKSKYGGFWVAYPAGFAFLRKEDRAYAAALILSYYKKHK